MESYDTVREAYEEPRNKMDPCLSIKIHKIEILRQHYLVSVSKVDYSAGSPCILSSKGRENVVFKEVCP
jgi:hypothetical protein